MQIVQQLRDVLGNMKANCVDMVNIATHDSRMMSNVGMIADWAPCVLILYRTSCRKDFDYGRR